MMPLCCLSILLLCLSAKAENVTVYRDPGEDVTLECSACSSSTEGYDGMYLYHGCLELEEVLYYHPNPGSTDKITPRERYINRIQTDGSLMKHTITISNLTVDDFGIYSCVYIKSANAKVRCNHHTLSARVMAPCSRSVPSAQVSEKSQPLVLIIVVSCAISTLVTVIFILLIVPRVKQCTSSRRTETRVPQVSNDYVYEVMTKTGLQPIAAPEQSPPSPYGFV